MPIELSEFSTPSFIRYKTRYPLTEDRKDRFMTFDNIRSYRGEQGYKLPGYNPNHNSTRTEKINLFVDDYTLKPR